MKFMFRRSRREFSHPKIRTLVVWQYNLDRLVVNDDGGKRPTVTMMARDEMKHEINIVGFGFHHFEMLLKHCQRLHLVSRTLRISTFPLSKAMRSLRARWHAGLGPRCLVLEEGNLTAFSQQHLKAFIGFAHVVKPPCEGEVFDKLL